jgi:predicted MFS family arabinose efflux permease
MAGPEPDLSGQGDPVPAPRKVHPALRSGPPDGDLPEGLPLLDEEVVGRALTGFRRMRPGTFTRRERNALLGLTAAYSLGILGLYMVLPVLSPYAHSLPGRTDLLVGLSIGAYGLTQALFQIPIGHLSDRIGRKRAIVLGLVLFAAGGAVSASAGRIEVLIAGRFLQGAGAVASSVTSLAADLTRPSVRTQAMARIGLAVGGSFALGLALGPVLAHHLGIRTLFWGISALSVLAAAYLTIAVPAAGRSRERAADLMHAGDLGAILRMRPVLLLYGGAFLLHLTVTVLFVLVPYDLARTSGLHQVWKVILPAAAVGLGAMTVSARLTDRSGGRTRVLLAGGGLLVAATATMAAAGSRAAGTLVGVLLFVLAVAVVEPFLASLMSRFAAGRHRGAAMGVFHTSQFLGTFSGGIAGGAFLGAGREPLYLGLAAAFALWTTALARALREGEATLP